MSLQASIGFVSFPSFLLSKFESWNKNSFKVSTLSITDLERKFEFRKESCLLIETWILTDIDTNIMWSKWEYQDLDNLKYIGRIPSKFFYRINSSNFSFNIFSSSIEFNRSWLSARTSIANIVICVFITHKPKEFLL